MPRARSSSPRPTSRSGSRRSSRCSIPDTLSLSNVFEEIRAEADADDVLVDSVAGELISSEVEIRSGKGEDFGDALERQHERRRRLFALAEARGVALGATGTHPWSPWQEQRIIDTPHYRRVEEELKYVAWRNNTFSNHVHVGIRGADRAVAVCDALRPVLPMLLAASANSAWVEERLQRPALGAHADLHPDVPALRGPGPLRQLARPTRTTSTSSSGRARSSSTRRSGGACGRTSRFGTVEMRIMDAQSCAGESTALLALATACVGAGGARLRRRPDRAEPVPGRLIEENIWRAIRHGLDGKLIDLDAARGDSRRGGGRAPAGVDRRRAGRAAARRAPRRPGRRCSRTATAPSASGAGTTASRCRTSTPRPSPTPARPTPRQGPRWRPPAERRDER